MTSTEVIPGTAAMDTRAVNATLMSVFNGRSIDSMMSEKIFEHLFTGNLSEIELAGMLMAMKLRGETPDEISGAARSMRKFCKTLDLGTDMVFDTCGTGGDNSRRSARQWEDAAPCCQLHRPHAPPPLRCLRALL